MEMAIAIYLLAAGSFYTGLAMLARPDPASERPRKRMRLVACHK